MHKFEFISAFLQAVDKNSINICIYSNGSEEPLECMVLRNHTQKVCVWYVQLFCLQKSCTFFVDIILAEYLTTFLGIIDIMSFCLAYSLRRFSTFVQF